MSGILRWEDPPAEHGNKKPPRPSKYQPVVDDMKANPGRWAVIAENKTPGAAGGLADRIRKGVGPFAPLGAFEAKVIGPAGGGSKSTLYARYLGDDEDFGIDPVFDIYGRKS